MNSNSGTSPIHDQIMQFITEHFLQGDASATLLPMTPLVSGGILDSLGVLELVAFLESTFGVEFEAHEVSRDRLDTIADIEALVHGKIRQRP